MLIPVVVGGGGGLAVTWISSTVGLFHWVVTWSALSSAAVPPLSLVRYLHLPPPAGNNMDIKAIGNDFGLDLPGMVRFEKLRRGAAPNLRHKLLAVDQNIATWQNEMVRICACVWGIVYPYCLCIHVNVKKLGSSASNTFIAQNQNYYQLQGGQQYLWCFSSYEACFSKRPFTYSVVLHWSWSHYMCLYIQYH